jgi:hypothetical protein
MGCPPRFTRGVPLPAADHRRQALGRRQRRGCRHQRLGRESHVGIATPHPSPRDDRLTCGGPAGCLGRDRAMLRALAIPGGRGDRAPACRRSGQALRQRRPPLALLARASVLPGVMRRGRRRERRREAHPGAHPSGVTDCLTPRTRRRRAVTPHDQLPGGPPAAHPPHGGPCTVPQRSGGTAAWRIGVRRGRQHRQACPPDPRAPRDRHQEPQAHPASPTSVHDVRRRGTYRDSSPPRRGPPCASSPCARLVAPEHPRPRRRQGAPQPLAPRTAARQRGPWRPRPHSGGGLEGLVRTAAHNTEDSGHRARPRRQEDPDQQSCGVREEALRAQRSEGSTNGGKR